MSTSNLFAGIAVIIDDEAESPSANICNLIKQIEEKNIPCLKYTDLPKRDVLQNLKGIALLILDWKLNSQALSQDEIQAGVKLPTGINDGTKSSIEFLTNIKDQLFAPVFIFTNEDVNYIANILKRNKLLVDGRPNFILIKRKGDLLDDKLFIEIEKWVNETLPIYVMKEWEHEYETAKRNLFKDFFQLSPSWPQILWKNYANDSVNTSKELGDLITRNLYTRMSPFNFKTENFNGTGTNNEREIRKVLEGERFIKNERLHTDTVAAGDVFKNKRKTYINIRPDCDCVSRCTKDSNRSNDIKLYLLEGDKLSNEGKHFDETYGHFRETDSRTIVFSMLGGKTFCFLFKDITVVNWSEWKSKRIGRLLPPYITRIQQRYSLYLQRQGLPRVPNLFSKSDEVSPTHETVAPGHGKSNGESTSSDNPESTPDPPASQKAGSD